MNGELWLVLSSGFLGAGHCLGMCGPFAILIGSSSRSMLENIGRQSVYGVGRMTTYSFLGACVGFGVNYVTRWTGLSSKAVAGGYLLVGGFLIFQALKQFGWSMPRWTRRNLSQNPNPVGCLGIGFLRSYLGDRSWYGRYMAGVATGFLPCGLVYSFLALAAQTGNPLRGALTMATFGLGTMLPMIAAGCIGTAVSPRFRTGLLRLAACSIVVLGTTLVVRGIETLRSNDRGISFSPSCPACLDLSHPD
jgi:uncharacterized protein